MKTSARHILLVMLAVLALPAACDREPAAEQPAADSPAAEPATEQPADVEELYALALEDRAGFAALVADGANSDFEQAHAVVTWFADHFDWTYTDYQVRTVEEILERRGGNCSELARVTQAMLEELDLPMRRVREINIHVESADRQQRAEEKVAEMGLHLSVFGRRHNDHVWIEVQNRATGEWFPADPSMGVIGEREWLAARFGFGARFTLDPTSEDMVVPFAVFAEDAEGDLTENRTAHYAIDGFDALYEGRLRELPAWPDWVRLVEELDSQALGAFRGTVNLHEHASQIDELAATYEALREQYAAVDAGREG